MCFVQSFEEIFVQIAQIAQKQSVSRILHTDCFCICKLISAVRRKAERLAVSALAHCGVLFVRAHLNCGDTAVAVVCAVVSAVCDCTRNALVCKLLCSHFSISSVSSICNAAIFHGFVFIIPYVRGFIHGNRNPHTLGYADFLCMVVKTCPNNL